VGPTLIVQQNDEITVNLVNELDVPVSIVFPGQTGVTAEGDLLSQPGLLGLEALPGGSVSYTFTASRAGTFHYHGGYRPELQIEMGLVGAIIVRPVGFNPAAPQAYENAQSEYDQETLFLLTEMDSRIHETLAFFGIEALDDTDYLNKYFPNYWFINGRNAPDTMLRNFAPWRPYQPYRCLPEMHPGEKLLMRVINVGRDLHPFHHHGNHARIIGKDGVPLKTPAAADLDLSHSVFTIQSVPGETVDAIFEWTGKGLGWDIYGHEPGDPMEEGEYEPDHGKPFPVTLPEQQSLTFGGFYSGSPFLGVFGRLPPGQGGLNMTAGFLYMWHSHTEKEMVNFDLFPGGMMTMLIVQPPGGMMP